MSEMHRHVRGGRLHPPLRISLDDSRDQWLWQVLSRARLRTLARVMVMYGHSTETATPRS